MSSSAEGCEKCVKESDPYNRRVIPEPDGSRPSVSRRPTSWRVSIAALLGVLVGMLLTGPQTVRAAWEQVARFLSLEGEPAPASANVLSEHEIEGLDRAAPQSQAQLLLERSINHYRGANEQIAARVGAWRGADHIDDTSARAVHDRTEFRRCACARRRSRSTSRVAVSRKRPPRWSGSSLPLVSGEQGPRANALWDMGAHRQPRRRAGSRRCVGVCSDPCCDRKREHPLLGRGRIGVPGVRTESSRRLLDVFHDDPSPLIRERAALRPLTIGDAERATTADGCAASARIRRGLVALCTQTRKWVFQALRDITGQTLAHDASAWRQWVQREQSALESRDAGRTLLRSSRACLGADAAIAGAAVRKSHTPVQI